MDRYQLKGDGSPLLKIRQNPQHGEAVPSSGHPHKDTVISGYELIVMDGPARQAADLLFKLSFHITIFPGPPSP